MPFISEKFKTYDAFAKANLTEIYTQSSLDQATKFSVESFSHIYMENIGNGEFASHDLPIETQTGPIKDFIVLDYNNDGNLDFIFGGNHYQAEVETVRYDGQKGGLCIGLGDGTFEYVPSHKSQMYFNHDLRDIKQIQIQSEPYLLIASNNDSLRCIKQDIIEK